MTWITVMQKLYTCIFFNKRVQSHFDFLYVIIITTKGMQVVAKSRNGHHSWQQFYLNDMGPSKDA